MIYVDDETKKIEFTDKTGHVDPDAYFVIRRELPYEGYEAYMDAALNYEADASGALVTESNKLKQSEIAHILMHYGLIEVVGVMEKKSGQPVTAENWKKLPSDLIRQITQAIQEVATSTEVGGDPNVGEPSVAS